MVAQRKRPILLSAPGAGGAVNLRRALALGLALNLGLAMILGLALVLTGTRALAEAFPRTLEDIKVFGRGELIQLIFSQPYEGMPTEEHAPGRMSLTFVGVGSQKPVRDLRPREESLYKEIKVVQYRNSTTVTFLLRDPTLNLKDRVSLSRDKNRLNVELRLDGTAASGTVASGTVAGGTVAPLPSDPRFASEPLLSELEQKIAGMPAVKVATAASQTTRSVPAEPAPTVAPTAAPTAAPVAFPAAAPAGPAAAPSDAASAAPAGKAAPLGLGGMPESNFFAALATMVVGLAVMLGALYGVLYLYKRTFRSRLARFAGTPALRQIASFSIGPRQRIVILEINGEWIACGVTPSQITFLTRLSGAQPAAAAEAPAVADGATGVPAEAEPAAPAAKADPVHQFAEVLKQKVRSLKRIN